MKPPFTPGHGGSLAGTCGITSVIATVGGMALLGQCKDGIQGIELVLATLALVGFVGGAGGLYFGRNAVGTFLDVAGSDPARAQVAAAEGLAWFHAGMAGVLAGCGFGTAFRLALPFGGVAWLAPLVAFACCLVAAGQALAWAQEARRRSASLPSPGEASAVSPVPGPGAR